MTNQTQHPYTFPNQQQFPFLTQLPQFLNAKLNTIHSLNFNQFIVNSTPLITNWLNFKSPEQILLEIDDNQRTVQFYTQHPRFSINCELQQHHLQFQLNQHQFRKFNHHLIYKLGKNFINKAISPEFTFLSKTYNPQDFSSLQDKTHWLGVKFDLGKWLDSSTITNQKQIYFRARDRSLKNPLFPNYDLKLHLTNRANEHKIKNKKADGSQNPIARKSSDIIGYNLSTTYKNLGLTLGSSGGYDYFQGYKFNKFAFQLKKTKQLTYNNIEFIMKGGVVIGNNLMENDMLTRSQRRWQDDRSKGYLSTRLNVVLKNYFPIIGEKVNLRPLLFVEGCVSRNSKEKVGKWELDYGIGVMLRNKVTFDLSLVRVGRSLEVGSPGIKIIF